MTDDQEAEARNTDEPAPEDSHCDLATGSHPDGADNIRADAGHMMYLHPPSRQKLAKDLHYFYESALR